MNVTDNVLDAADVVTTALKKKDRQTAVALRKALDKKGFHPNMLGYALRAIADDADAEQIIHARGAGNSVTYIINPTDKEREADKRRMVRENLTRVIHAVHINHAEGRVDRYLRNAQAELQDIVTLYDLEASSRR